MRAILTTLWLAVAVARSHQIEEITMDLETGEGRWRAVMRLDAAYMLPEFRGDADIDPLDLAWLRARSPDEWARIRDETRRFLAESLVVGEGGASPSFPDFDVSPPAFMARGEPEELPEIVVELTGPAPGESLAVAWRETFGVVLIVRRGDEVFPLVSGETKRIATDGAPSRHFVDWLVLGFRHILPAGLDHILFILGVFLLRPAWKPLLWQSLTFTVAHSITLAAAALGWVVLPEKWVECAIALSIAWIALENLWLREPGWRRYATIAGFGLVHGLGFARMLAVALPESGPLLVPLVGFNAGVELGQLTVLGTAGALTAWWSERATARLRHAGSIAIATAGLAWFVTRCF